MYDFDYQRPTDRAAAAAAIQGAEARFLAGGQTLIQAMKLRLSSSERLVDLGGIADLKGIRLDGGNLVIGAMTPHSAVARSAEVQRACPALAELAGGIGDAMVRNVGTLGGSFANADPAVVELASVNGRRTVPIGEFMVGVKRTAIEPGELIVSVSFPSVHKAAYEKYKQPASRFALVGVFVAQAAGGVPNAVRVAVSGAKSSVYRCAELEAALGKSFTAAAAKAVKLPATDMNSDLHGSAQYRAAMVSVMAARAVEQVLAR